MRPAILFLVFISLIHVSHSQIAEYSVKYSIITQKVVEVISKNHSRIRLENTKNFAYNEQFTTPIKAEKNKLKEADNNLSNSLFNKSQESFSKNSNWIFLTLVLSGILILFLTILFFYKYKGQTQLALKNENSSAQPIYNSQEVLSEGKTSQEYMNKSTEEKILKDLKALEKTSFFLDKNLSLNVLAGKMGINQRYLTYVIKKNKKTDFASYINSLRIQYIVKCLEENPEYLNYKISYLAEEAGYSSHSRFTINFKKVTGLIPSVFIQKIKDKMK